MATQEAALKAEISRFADTEEMKFALKNYPFVSSYWCKSQPLPQKCTNEGQSRFIQFNHGLKLAKVRAEQCMGACAEEACYKGCTAALSEAVGKLYEPLAPVLEDYLLNR
jgi:hypothetical protein